MNSSTNDVIKLHIGCGKKYIDGYIHVDIQPGDNIDIVCDVGDIDIHFKSNSVDEIYLCHILEHVERTTTEKYKDVRDVLAKLYDILKPGGVIRISVPDFEAVANVYIKGRFVLHDLLGLLYGGARDEYDVHTACFDFLTLRALLFGVGFQQVSRYVAEDFLPLGYDDYSLAYLPHMDSRYGTLMSLNIMAFK